MNGIKEEKRFWDSTRARRTADHPSVRAFVAPKLEMIVREKRIGQDSSVLDLVCGNGYFTVPLSRLANVVGLDLSRRMLSLNRHDGCVLGSALNLPFGENSFDVVLCANLLHHLNEPWMAL